MSLSASFKKKDAYQHEVRPVFYLSDEEVGLLGIPKDELWRVVSFEEAEEGWISWLHEREWRCRSNFRLPEKPTGVLVRSPVWAQVLQKQIAKDPRKFTVKPQSIIPLTVLCQGLPDLRGQATPRPSR
jgi:hypothetical protein